MSDKSKLRFLVDGEFVVRCDIDEGTNAFDFVLESGRQKDIRFPDATPTEIAILASDLSDYGAQVTLYPRKPR
jgi:hypothetical protein